MKVKPFSIAGNILFSSKKYISSQRGGTWTRCKRQNKKSPTKPSVFQRLILLGFTRGTTRELMAGDCEAAIYSYT